MLGQLWDEFIPIKDKEMKKEDQEVVQNKFLASILGGGATGCGVGK